MRKENKRKFNEKPSIILGCPGARYDITAAAVAVAMASDVAVAVAVAVTVAVAATVAVAVACQQIMWTVETKTMSKFT